MRIIASVKPGAKEDLIEKIGESEFKVSVKKPPREGAENEAVMNLLFEYFSVPKSSLRLVKGRKSRKKVFDIQGWK